METELHENSISVTTSALESKLETSAKTSCVIAVHNEAKYLRYSLPYLLTSPFEEIVFVLDRCKDNSEQIIKQYGDARFKVLCKNEANWQNPCAEAKNFGCSKATHNLLLITDADMVLDLKAVQNGIRMFEQNKNVTLVCLAYKQYSLHGTILQRLGDEWINFIGMIVRKLGVQPRRGGIYLVRKEIAAIQDSPSEYDFLQQKHKVIRIETKSLHLRPRFSKKAQISRGKARMHLPQYNVIKVLLASILQLQPYMLFSYLSERRQH